jgi:hypothetical protein
VGVARRDPFKDSASRGQPDRFARGDCCLCRSMMPAWVKPANGVQGVVAGPTTQSLPSLRVAKLGAGALLIAGALTALAHPLSLYLPGSLVFSATLVALAILSHFKLDDRGVSLAAAATSGAVPFVVFCCDQALTIPTWDSRALEGIGPIFVAVVALFLLAMGPLVMFVVALPIGVWPTAGHAPSCASWQGSPSPPRSASVSQARYVALGFLIRTAMFLRCPPSPR